MTKASADSFLIFRPKRALRTFSGGRLLGALLRRPLGLGQDLVPEADLDGEGPVVGRALLADEAVGGRGESRFLAELLERGLGVVDGLGIPDLDRLAGAAPSSGREEGRWAASKPPSR
ncbi:MAG: hypothetical protein MZU95_01890 [Desulfomicrobium escambiense]|nr:hypothetical protein [Desulfomicrobium escambiense]